MQILKAMGKGGGTEAPNARRKQIREGLAKGPAGARTLPAGLPPIRYPAGKHPLGNRGPLEPVGPGTRAPATGSSVRQPGSPSVGGAVQPKLGAQLSNRVQNGAIGQGQAQKVAKQRAMLQKAFGSDWRSRVYGQGGAKGLKASGPFGTAAVRTKRNAALERAKRKLY